jgi:hypothetical protein
MASKDLVTREVAQSRNASSMMRRSGSAPLVSKINDSPRQIMQRKQIADLFGHGKVLQRVLRIGGFDYMGPDLIRHQAEEAGAGNETVQHLIHVGGDDESIVTYRSWVDAADETMGEYSSNDDTESTDTSEDEMDTSS